MYAYEVLETGEVFSRHSYVDGDPFPPALRNGTFIVADTFQEPGCIYKDGVFSSKEENSLDILKDLKWREIKDARDQAEFGPFMYNNMLFDGDADAQRRLMVYISISKSALEKGENLTREFILADNTVVTLDANDFVGIELAKANQVADAFSKAASLRLQIDQASSKEELQAIAWE